MKRRISHAGLWLALAVLAGIAATGFKKHTVRSRQHEVRRRCSARKEDVVEFSRIELPGHGVAHVDRDLIRREFIELDVATA